MRTPRRASRARVAGPTPQSRSTGSGWRNASSSPGSITSRPSGLEVSDASLARNFVLATPTDTVRPVSARTRVRIVAAISRPGPNRRRPPDTSRNASSSAIGSTRGV